jgi:Tol biopolymer transport system component
MRSWLLRLRGTAAASAIVCAQLAVAAPAVSAAPQRSQPPTPHTASLAAPVGSNQPRVAFTDDQDRLVAVERGIPTPAGFGTATVHEGEASDNGNGVAAFVSTHDQPNGEVYLTNSATPAGPVQVTCDTGATKTHPVVSPDGANVAYASNQSGRWDIWVATLPSNPPAAGCTGITYEQITAGAGDNLWPAWDGLSLVFSSTRDNPLGDLYEWRPDFGPGLVGGPALSSSALASTTVRLTDGAQANGKRVANTQPAVATFAFSESIDGTTSSVTFILFTTTQHRVDGSLAYLPIPDGPTPPAATTFPSPWPGTAPQSSEPAWSPTLTSTSDGSTTVSSDAVAFTTTEDDPYGKVRTVAVDGFSTTAGTLSLHTFAFSRPVGGAVPGQAESHGGWDTSGCGDGACTADPTRLIVTTRSIAADVSDVIAADGSGRRTLAHASFGDPPAVLDSSAPAYSPDGTRIAYSQQVVEPGVGVRGRAIVVADADGSNAVTPDFGRSAATQVLYDTQPAWSPDGKKIAFVREEQKRSDPVVTAVPRIWIGDLATGTASRLPVPDAGQFFDEHPSWSPDGGRLVFSRVAAPADVVVSTAQAAPITTTPGSTEITTTVSNRGFGTAAGVSVTITVPVQLRVTAVPPGCALAETEPQTITCTPGTLAPGAEVAITFTANSTLSCGDHTAVVHASATSTSIDPDPANNSADMTVTMNLPPCPADVTVAVEATPATINTDVGNTTQITVTVDNTGVGPAQNVILTITIPGGLSGTVPAQCTSAGTAPQVLTCGLGPLAPGASVVKVLTATNTFTCGDHTAVVGATAATPSDPSPGHDEVNVAIRGLPGCINLHLADIPGEGLASIEAAPVAAGPAIRDAVRGIPNPPPPELEPQLWTVDSGTGAGAPLLLPASSCAAAPCVVAGRTPAWSPDGLRIAYDAGGQILLAALTDTNGDGRADTPESSTALTPVTGFRPDGLTPLPSRAAISAAHDPAWAPDGSEILFAGQPAGQPDQSGIYALAPDGTGLRTVAQQPGPETEPAAAPIADLGVTLTAAPSTISLSTASTLTATVTNAGPSRAGAVTLTLTIPAGLSVATVPAPCSRAAGTITCPLGVLAKGAQRTIVVSATGTALGVHTATATVSAAAADPDLSDNTATASVTVTAKPRADVAVTVQLSESTGYVGGALTATIKVVNKGPSPAAAVRLAVSTAGHLAMRSASAGCVQAGTPCALGTLAVNGHATFTARLVPTAAGSATVTGKVSTTTVDPVPANNTATASLALKQPRIRLLPPIGPPGFVTLAFGEDFPPGATVALTWQIGINANPGTVTVDGDGTFRAPMLIVRRDRLGTRLLVARSGTGQFSQLTTPMLVVPGSETPPRFLGRK